MAAVMSGMMLSAEYVWSGDGPGLEVITPTSGQKMVLSVQWNVPKIPAAVPLIIMETSGSAG
jgi:hypothetical protein